MRPWTGIKQQSCRHLADVCSRLQTGDAGKTGGLQAAGRNGPCFDDALTPSQL